MGLEKFAGENLMTRQVEALERIASALDYVVDSRKPSSYTPSIGTLVGTVLTSEYMAPSTVDPFSLPAPYGRWERKNNTPTTVLDSPEKQSGLDGDVR